LRRRCWPSRVADRMKPRPLAHRYSLLDVSPDTLLTHAGAWHLSNTCLGKFMTRGFRHCGFR
jgi:hypothetical protein